jgi:hypothetical protein
MANVPQGGVPFFFFQKDAVFYVVPQAELAVTQQVNIHDLDIRLGRADIVGLGECRADGPVTPLVMDCSDLAVFRIPLIRQ